MKRRIHIELLATSGLAILLTLTFALFVFYGLFRTQIIRDLRTDARVMKNMGVFTMFPGWLSPTWPEVRCGFSVSYHPAYSII